MQIQEVATKPTRKYTNPRKPRCLQLAVCAILISVLVAGCGNPQASPEPKIITVLDPVLVKQMTLEGQLITANRGETVSPDGKYLLAAVRGDPLETMSAIPITPEADEGSGAAASGTGDAQPITLYSVEKSWTSNNLVQWYPVGWLSDTKCLFIVHGWQSQGAHKGERGTAIFTGDLVSKEASLAAYVEVPTQGEVVDDAVLTPSGKMYLRVSEKFWEFTVTTGDLRLVRDDFPSYQGISTVVVSPDGSHVAFSVYGEGKSGIFVLDVATGAEKCVLPTGDSLSFYPTWSPDGEYVAAYTVKKVPDANLQGIGRYNFIPGEDLPLSSGQEITVLDVDGNILKTISIEGQYLSHAAWMADSESLVYLAGPVHFGKWGEVLSSEYATAFIAGVTGGTEPAKVADIAEIERETGQHTGYIFPVGSLPEGKAALLNIASAEGAAVWRVSTTAPPAKVADGWWNSPRLRAEYLDSVAGTISGEGENSLWLVGPSGASQFGVSGPNGFGIAAYSDDLLVIDSYDFVLRRTEIAVYDMLQEKADDPLR